MAVAAGRRGGHEEHLLGEQEGREPTVDRLVHLAHPRSLRDGAEVVISGGLDYYPGGGAASLASCVAETVMTGSFPGVDTTDVYEFLEAHAPA